MERAETVEKVIIEIPAKPKFEINKKPSEQTRKLRVAAYCRVSTDRFEQEDSFELQCAHFKDYISKNPNWELVKVYSDDGISGTHMKNRKQFLQMVEDAKNGMIDMILVKSISRYARNQIDSLTIMRDLRDQGVKIYFEKEHIDSTDPKADFTVSILSAVAEEESRNTSTNIRWSNQKKMERGEFKISVKRMLGLEKDENKQIVIEPVGAQIIQGIFRDYLNGMTCKEIAEELNAKGVLTGWGKKWTNVTIKTILTNEKYCGDAIYQKTYSQDFLSNKRVKNTGQVPQYYVKNNHPAIISREKFDLTQAEIRRRENLRSDSKTGKGKYTSKYAFSGLLFCGTCGSKFRRFSYEQNGKRLDKWICINHQTNKESGCNMKAIYENDLEDAFVRGMNKIIGEGFTKTLENRISREMARDEDRETMNNLDKKLKNLQDRAFEIAKDFKDNIIDLNTYTYRINNTMSDIDKISAALAKLKTKEQDEKLRKHTMEQIKKIIKQSIKEFDKDIFRALVDEVIIMTQVQAKFILKSGFEFIENLK